MFRDSDIATKVVVALVGAFVCFLIGYLGTGGTF
jgi:hypothetical protein